MLKVKLLKNIRIFNDYPTDFTIVTGETKVLRERDLQAYSIKGALFGGILQVIEGEMIFRIKKARILFTDKDPSNCFGIDSVGGEKKYFTRDLITLDFLYYEAPEDMPTTFRDLLEEKVAIKVLTDKKKLYEKESLIDLKVLNKEKQANKKKIMSEKEIKNLNKAEQDFLIKSLANIKSPKYESDRVKTLLKIQEKGYNFTKELLKRELFKNDL